MYYINEYGDVYSTYSHKIIKCFPNKDKHFRVYIHGRRQFVHRLVYEHWVGKIPFGMQINHKDDNPVNNHYSNLYVGTQKDNVSDCIKNKHRIGNVYYLIVHDKITNKQITFCPAYEFIKYSGHSCNNGNLRRIFTKKWFNKRYTVIEYKKINTISHRQSVTTMADECKPVG